MAERYLIKIRNGAPHGDPFIWSNYHLAFPEMDIDNLPDNYMEYFPQKYTQAHPHDKKTGYTYEIQDGVVKQVFQTTRMEGTELEEYHTQVKSDWYAETEYNSWNYDANTSIFYPPTPYPEDDPDNEYEWNEANTTWVIIS